MTPLKKIVIGIIIIILIPFLLALDLWLYERYFIFNPKIYPAGNWHPVGIVPIDVWLKSVDGTRIHGWYLPYKNPKAIILYLQGNKGNVTDSYPELVKLHNRLHASVMVFDYRGFGRSEGKPEEKLIANDAEMARDWLAHKEHIRPDEVILLGRSLGGAVAVDLASRLGAKGLILIGTFLSLPDIVSYHYPIPFVRRIMHNQFDNIHKIVNYRGPLLVIHGDADELVPLEHGKKLFAAAPGPKTFYQIPGGKHFSPLTKEVYQVIGKFVTKITNSRG